MKRDDKEPVYLESWLNGKLEEKIRVATGRLESCTLCPRQCGVNRQAGETGICMTGRKARVASAHPHYGEEPPISGYRGSGTIFFGGCNLGCAFCQNADISHQAAGTEVDVDELAGIMIRLQELGCHNINLVTPSHVVPQILEALVPAIRDGLRIPLVYNTSGFDEVATLKLLEGLVDIYMPDLKFTGRQPAEKYCGAPDYPEKAKQALIEMFRQVGNLVTDHRGIALHGILVRHLVLPGNLAGTEKVVKFLSEKVSPDLWINLMDQYYPSGKAFHYPELNRRIRYEEYEEALRITRKAGLNLVE